MRHKIMKFVAAGCLAALCGNAFGTACTSNGTLTGSTTDDTCTGTDQLVLSCSDTTPIGGAKEFIYSVTLSASSSATIKVNSANFNPYIALMQGASCNSTDPCGAFENLGTSGNDVSIGPTTGSAAGQYWLVITDAGNASACGSFTLTVTGTLPVKLQNFSVD